MLRSTADTLSDSANGVCALVLPVQLSDDPVVLKALLLAQQHAFEAREAERQAAFRAREAELQKSVRSAHPRALRTGAPSA